MYHIGFSPPTRLRLPIPYHPEHAAIRQPSSTTPTLRKSRIVLYCTHMNTDTFSVRVARSTRTRLEKLAKSTGRSRSFLAAEAIAAYLDTNEWQISGITAALSSLDRGRRIPHDRVKQWVASWETTKERPTPRGV